MNKKLIILHIACLSGNRFSGVGVVVPQHIKHQSKYANVAFLNIGTEKVFDEKLQLEYNEKFDINKLAFPFNKPDLVVFHEAYRLDYLKIAKNLRKNNISYIIVPHGELSQSAQKKKRLKKMLANILLFNGLVNKSQGIQCLSKKEKDDTKFRAKKFVCSNGVSLPNDYKISNEAKKIIYIGRLDSYHKGLDLLFKAVEIEKKEGKNIHIDLFGPNRYSYHEKLHEMVKEYNIESCIEVHDGVLGKEKEALLLSSDVFIQTSRFEGMPMGILEALSYGLPCLVTSGTNMSEDIENSNAGWVAETNVESIKKAIDLMLCSKSEEIKQKSINARNLVNNKYEWNTIAKNTIEEYSRILGIKK